MWYSLQAEVPLDVLAERERARAAIVAIIPKLSKRIEQEHLHAARVDQ